MLKGVCVVTAGVKAQLTSPAAHGAQRYLITLINAQTGELVVYDDVTPENDL